MYIYIKKVVLHYLIQSSRKQIHVLTIFLLKRIPIFLFLSMLL